MRPPVQCPRCGEITAWKEKNTTVENAVAGALTGALLLGPVGLLGGMKKPRNHLHVCGKCGFQHIYSYK